MGAAFRASYLCDFPIYIVEQDCIALFTRQMFRVLHVQWACTLIGCVACLMMPIPFVFYKFGPKIRERSRFAPCEVSPSILSKFGLDQCNFLQDLKIKDIVCQEERKAKMEDISEEPA